MTGCSGKVDFVQMIAKAQQDAVKIIDTLTFLAMDIGGQEVLERNSMR